MGIEKLFGTDGIRGRANIYPIVPEVALRLGKTIAHVFAQSGPGRPRVLIGKDTRLSGYMLETALTSGLVSMGVDVLLVGPIPTPAVAHLTRSMNATVGIMLTASHNPFDDNGIKIFDREGYKLSEAVERQIEEVMFNGQMVTDHIRSSGLGRAFRIEDARGRYIEYAKSTISNLVLEDLKIVLDCANGAAYQIGPWIFRELGANVIKTGVEPDGYNINAQCGALFPENIGQLVREHQADIGIAFDGDADRVVFCDHRGCPVDGDRILAMCALDLKAQGRLAKDTLVVSTLSNLGLYSSMREHGIQVVATSVGDRWVIEKMREGGFTFGGEKSGHLVFMDYATAGDGIIAALQVLKLMRRRSQPLAELADCMEEFPAFLRDLVVQEKPPLEGFPRLEARLRECEVALRGEGRVLVRYSGTEPKLRVLVEARDEELGAYWLQVMVETVQEELGL